MTNPTMTCEQLAEQLGGYLEDELDPNARASIEAHTASCAGCSALLADLRAIETEARSLPELAPSRDLWSGIGERIAAPVIALPAAATPAPDRRFGWQWMSAAAAALVVATAGVTYSVTKASLMDSVVGRRSSVVETAATPDARPESTVAAPAAEIASPATEMPSVVASNAEPSRQPSRAAPETVLVQTVSTAAEATFNVEIARLRTVLDQRRDYLDPATVAILERNLQVIDIAIEESRAALARDPANRFLTQQLNGTLGKKVELLRTAAMLPARI